MAEAARDCLAVNLGLGLAMTAPVTTTALPDGASGFIAVLISIVDTLLIGNLGLALEVSTIVFFPDVSASLA
ncbi:MULTISPECIES: hypothetical protein [unclassified Rhizobium]|uniref:hypothetical protein n=1 Tax=unclassified Rhizobium TaxID=2613769 RepID=UPI00161B25D0|nr:MULTISPECIES: hypothetical protein [unclassified Rhizobium]MBB3386620.1 putative membrane-anchored protein [Rhizobium sp. BK098]MBB3618324.1 putative membrane-anchored protein [Rhizobium sp. BK609]MBB3683981.1 putative membrane-anchored protein [Rhizobium sp. BK612]